MRRSHRALAAGIAVSTVLSSVAAVARADASSVLYVDNGTSAGCTDTGAGAGSATTPFCTVQAAADAAAPGDVVEIAAGTYRGAVNITSSGTSTAPIVFQPTGGYVDIANASGQTGFPLTFTGASYVEFEGSVGTGQPENQRFSINGVAVSASSHITLDSLFLGGSAESVEITGASADDVLSRSVLDGREGGVLITAGGSGDVISTNQIGAGTFGVDVVGSTGTVITSNMITGSTPPSGLITLGSGATGTVIENNIVDLPEVIAGPVHGISVDSASTAGTTEDYNVVWPSEAEGSPGEISAYLWAGVAYTSQSAFTAATGQGGHDSLDNPQFNAPPYTLDVDSPQIDSANSAAPGMLGTDLYGYPCTIDPVVTVTGAGSPAYCSRGAVQQSYTTSVTASAAPTGALSVNLSSAMAQTSLIEGVTYDVRPAPTPAVSYVIGWGDGTSSAPIAGSATSATTAMTHTYARIGTYTITDTAQLTDGTTTTTTAAFTTAGSGYTAIGPTRMLDTRYGTGAAKAKVAAGKSVTLQLAGIDGIPAGVTAVALNLTATDTTGNGYLAAAPTGSGESTSNLNYLAGQTVANSAIVPVADGSITIFNSGAGSADVIADVSGYFTKNAGAGYSAAPLARILDTRHGIGAAQAKVAAGSAVPVAIAGADGIPTGVSAVAVHITVTDTTGNGWIAAEADGSGVAGTSSLNYLKGQTVSNTVIVPVAADGKIELYNGGGTTPVDLIADVSGYFSPEATAAYVAIDPYREWDSRADYDFLPANGSQLYELDIPNYSPYTIPAGSSVITNITLTDEAANGFITAYPYGTAKPATSNLNYLKKQNVAGLSILGTTGIPDYISVYNQSSGTSDIILDVFGYFATS